MKLIICTLLIFLSTTIILAQTNQKANIDAEKRAAFIDKANKLRANEAFLEASYFLDSILVINPKDAPILLYKGDLMLQAKLFAKAVEVYKKLIPMQYEPTIAKINLSYALFMNHNTSKALQMAKQAWQNDVSNKSAIVNYFNAQLWNIKTKDANLFLQQQQQNLPKDQVLILKARLFTTEGNYKKGFTYYDSATKISDSKFYVQEYSEVLIGKRDYLTAAQIINQNKSKLSSNDLKEMNSKLKAGNTQFVGSELSYFTDVANNTRIENKYWWQQGNSKKYQVGVAAGWGLIKSENNLKTNTQFIQIDVNENWSNALKGETKLQVQNINPTQGANFTVFTGQQIVKYQPNDRRMFGIYYKKEILNFTASLVDNNISSNNYGYLTHLMINGKAGFFSEGSFSNLSDKNKRFQFFGSLYKLLRTEPTLKLGLNFTALHYSDSSIKNYFSPNRYLHSEVFFDYSTPLPQSNKYYFQLQAATGFQKIENGKWESAARFQTEIGYRKNKIETALKYQTSNVSSNNGTGYKFNWFTLRLIYKF